MTQPYYNDMIDQIPHDFQNHVLVIGNFDGVHRGHQTVLAQAKKAANLLGCKVLALTFSPHPRLLFQPDQAPFLLTNAAQKKTLLHHYGADYVYDMPFTKALCQLSKDDFICDILQKGLKAQHIFVGADFRFGHQRAGSPHDIEKAGIPITVVQKIGDDTQQISYGSRVIRDYIASGDIESARHILGHDWCIEGEVKHGDHRGRTIGYPTANIELESLLHPAYGVYACWVRLHPDTAITNDPKLERLRQWLPAAANIGIRPMFELSVGRLEVHIMDFAPNEKFEADLYGKILQIIPVQKIRDEMKFNGLDALIHAIDHDCTQAIQLLQNKQIIANCG
jgi:riboflavin kinase/FMN adenylyltransferase